MFTPKSRYHHDSEDVTKQRYKYKEMSVGYRKMEEMFRVLKNPDRYNNLKYRIELRIDYYGGNKRYPKYLYACMINKDSSGLRHILKERTDIIRYKLDFYILEIKFGKNGSMVYNTIYEELDTTLGSLKTDILKRIDETVYPKHKKIYIMTEDDEEDMI